jgi:IclR family pca regulon transcriptional regulator
MAGLSKGLAILEAFDEARPSLTISEAALAAGISRAAARRCLLTLAERGYLAHDGKSFSPTPRTLRLGAFSLANPLPKLAEPHLVAARDALGESVSLAVLDGDDVVFVARAPAERIVSVGVRVGARLPAYSSATGRILLAALPEAELEACLKRCRFERPTANSPADLGQVRARIDEARRDGVAFMDEELELGLRAMAVPVADSLGKVRASLSVSAFAQRISRAEMLGKFHPLLVQAALDLGRKL